MPKIQFATRVDYQQAEQFKDITTKLGTTPSDALRMFVSAFNNAGGFPFDVRISNMQKVEAFETEEDATRFATDLAFKAL